MQSELQELQSLHQGEARAYYVSLRGKGSGQMGGPFSGGPLFRRPHPRVARSQVASQVHRWRLLRKLRAVLLPS